MVCVCVGVCSALHQARTDETVRLWTCTAYAVFATLSLREFVVARRLFDMVSQASWLFL